MLLLSSAADMASSSSSLSSLSPAEMATNNHSFTKWEELRKEARHLENEIEVKLVSLSKHGTSANGRVYEEDSDKEPLLSGSSHMFETMSFELEKLLSKLTEVNDKMGDYLSNLSFGEPNSAQLHTMQRHRDILQDYSHEFTKTKANIKATQEREDLLGSVRKDISAYKSGLNRRTELYLKEHEHIRHSDRLADETINMALATKENLHSQRRMFHSITGRVQALTGRFPAINNLVQKINLRKRRDSLILGFVIATCIIFILVFEFH